MEGELHDWRSFPMNRKFINSPNDFGRSQITTVYILLDFVHGIQFHRGTVGALVNIFVDISNGPDGTIDFHVDMSFVFSTQVGIIRNYPLITDREFLSSVRRMLRSDRETVRTTTIGRITKFIDDRLLHARTWEAS